jgi:hypothetical protein
VHWPDGVPLADAAWQLPPRHANPHPPQLFASVARFLQTFAFVPAPQQTAAGCAALQGFVLQSESSQSVFPSQSLSNPSPHDVSDASAGPPPPEHTHVPASPQVSPLGPQDFPRHAPS